MHIEQRLVDNLVHSWRWQCLPKVPLQSFLMLDIDDGSNIRMLREFLKIKLVLLLRLRLIVLCQEQVKDASKDALS